MFTKHHDAYSPVDEFKMYLTGMPESNAKQYIQQRVFDQINYYDKKSNIYQHRYKQFMIVSIILSAIIPVLTLMLSQKYEIIFKVIITAISSSITAISAIVSLYNYKDLWVQYRSNCEILKSVLHSFFNRCGEFTNLHDNELYATLINSCEGYMTKEFQSWITYTSKHQDSSNGS